MVEIAVLGHGVVGSGVVEVLAKNSDSITRRAGQAINVKYILDKRDFPGCPYEHKFTKDFQVILRDPSVKVVVEVMGGVTPAYDFVKDCLRSGKSVVTSNKELVAAKGASLLQLAKENNVNFLFEASVGGGIPIIRPLHQCLAANQIDEIAGILNGTTNYILTKMIKDGMPFDEALNNAQQLGYAEADPTADVEGHDACRKIAILASLAFGRHVYPQYVHTQGITAITSNDVAYAGQAGCVIKLIGQAHLTESGQVYVMVTPALIHRDSQLAGVDDVFNGILVRGDATGDVVFYGKGAGKLPTASAVVGDVIDCAKASGTIRSLNWADSGENIVADYLLYPAVYYVRCVGTGGKTAVKELFGRVEELPAPVQGDEEYAFFTPALPEGELITGLDKLERQGIRVLSSIRKLAY